MAYKFESLPQLVDKRGKLASKGKYSKRTRAITTRVWHHSLTKKALSGSTAEAFANYHVNTHGWPGVGYSIIIEPRNIVHTKNGPRARIVFANDIDLRTYHVGDSNQFCLGICVAGDYRTEKLDEPTIASIAELHEALVVDKIGKVDKAHQEMPGYAWKECCAFDYKKAFKYESVSNSKPDSLPDTYKIQEGDTFWSIAKGIKGLTVADIQKANPGVDPTKLKVGQKINLGKASGTSEKPKKEPSKPSSSKANLSVDGKWGESTTKALQKALKTPVDGIISDQTRNSVTTAFYGNTIAFGNGRKGSLMVKSLQRKIGATADGLLGPNTIKALQKYLGTTADGKLSRPSLVVKELQRKLNSGKF